MISTHTPAVNTDAVVTLAAATANRHHIKRVSWSYNGTPTGGALTVAYGTTTLTFHIVAGGADQLELDLVAAQNQEVVVTIAAGGSGVSGTVTVEHETVM